MWFIRRILASGVALALAATLGAGSAHAQMAQETQWNGLGPFNFEPYYTHYRLDGEGDRIGMDGFGGRMMWGIGTPDSMTVRPRAAIGVFGEYAPRQDLGFTMWHAGVHGDFNLLHQPWLGRISPVLSLSAGALSTGREQEENVEPRFPLATKSTTTFALTPSVGTRVRLWRSLGLRADVSDLITFRDETRHNVQFAAGLSFPF